MAKESLNERKKGIRKNISAVDRVLLDFSNPCQTLTSQIPSNNGQIIRSPHVVPIMWGNFYFTNRDYGFYVRQMLRDLVTRSYMNGHAQYGVQRGSVDDPINIDTGTDPDPTNLSRQDIQTRLFSWLTNGVVSPTPSVDEKSLVYIIFLPLGSTLSTADSALLSYHCPGASGAV